MERTLFLRSARTRCACMTPLSSTMDLPPFKTKIVEPVAAKSYSGRQKALQKAKYNLFKIHGHDISIDFLTDSGTGAMSAAQQAALMCGDESYAQCDSFYRFRDSIMEVTGMSTIIPVHQGRAAERIIAACCGGKDKVFISNTHFDTTRANFQSSGAQCLDFVIPEAREPLLDIKFKGNMDNELLETYLSENSKNVSMVFTTVTNNAGGGQPVSLANLRETSEICRKYGVQFWLDVARFAENAYFIKRDEEGMSDRTPMDIAQEMFSLADGAWMSMKKDALVHMGGFIAMKNTSGEMVESLSNNCILTEGFITYGGMAGRDMEACAVGLIEGLDENYLQSRISDTQYLHRRLMEANIPMLQPCGGHAVFIDAAKFAPHMKLWQLPGQSLAVAFYEIGGIRSCEIGTVMFADHSINELVRFAIPRRVYNRTHFDYVVEVVDHVYRHREDIKPMRLKKQPDFLRHFSADFAPFLSSWNIQELFDQIDADHSGTVSEDEFLHMFGEQRDVNESDLRKFFRHIDADGSGTISFDEFGYVLSSARYDPEFNSLVDKILRFDVLESLEA